MSALSNFVDGYILLLAARFGAPVTAARSPYDAGADGVEAAEEAAAWESVAQSLQAALQTPRTAEERRQLEHLDITAFGAKACRSRALHLSWQETVRSRERREAEAAAPPRLNTERRAAAPNGGPSAFDVTQHSLKDDVNFIHAAVRRCLPSAVVTESREETEDEAVARQERETQLAVYDVFVPTEAEQQRNAAIAAARDDFLTEVHRLQAAFYEKHRRWVDVPEGLLDGPVPGSSRGVQKAPPAASNDKDEERAALLAMLHSSTTTTNNNNNGNPPAKVASPADAIAALRRSIHVDRAIPRPSAAVSDEDIEKLYRDKGVPQLGGLGHLSLHPSAANGHASAPSSQQQRYEQAVARKTTSTAGPPVTAAAASRSAVAAPPTSHTAAGPAPTRHGRWQIVEYDEAEESGSDSDN